MGLFSSTSKTAGKNKKNTKKKSPLEVPKTAQDIICQKPVRVGMLMWKTG